MENWHDKTIDYGEDVGNVPWHFFMDRFFALD
jgi:hypothetical protein